MSTTIFRPGDIVPVSGIYGVVDVYGRKLGRQATCVEGEHFPPTRHGTNEYGWVLVRRTVHQP